MIKKAYQEINISKADGNIKNFAGQFIGLNYHKWTNKDTILLVTRFTEFKDFENPEADPTAVDMSGILSLRLAADTELASDAISLFTIDTFNNGDDPAFEDLANGLVTHKIVLNTAALDTYLGTEKSVNFVLQYSGQDAAGNAFTIPDGGITIELFEGVDQDDAPNDPEPPNTYLTTNEILRLIGGAADIAALTAIPEEELLNYQKTFVASEETDYWYDQAAVSGVHAPDDQTGGTGFWKVVGNPTIQDNLTAVTAPGATNDETEGYSKKSKWLDNSQNPIEAYECVDPSTAAAKWIKISLTIDELAAVALSGDKADIGLGNVNNTSDADKPVSTAQQTALDLKQNNISGASLTAATVADDDKITGQDTSDSNILKTFLAREIANRVDQLLKDLDINGNKIISTANGDIELKPHGTGNVILGSFKFNADQVIGVDQDNFVFTYDHSTGLINLEASAGGGGGGTSQNVFIDGQFNHWPEGASISADGYNAHVWGHNSGGGAATVTRKDFTPGQTDVPGNPKHYYEYQQTSDGSGVEVLFQRQKDCAKFANGNFTTSIYLKVPSGSVTLIPAFRQNFGTGSNSPSAEVETQGSSINVTTSWTKFDITIAVPDISTKTIGDNADTNYWEFVLLADDAETTFTAEVANIGGLEGSTSFDGPWPTELYELNRCREYFILFDNSSGAVPAVQDSSSTNYAYFFFPSMVRLGTLTYEGTIHMSLSGITNGEKTITTATRYLNKVSFRTSNGGPGRAHFNADKARLDARY